MTTKFTEFDPAEHMQDETTQAFILADAAESGDPQYIAHALGTIARARGMTQVAKDAGVTREALYKALSSEGDPRLSTLLGVMKALNLTMSIHPAKS
jgi:probable addiction module antidote protein